MFLKGDLRHTFVEKELVISIDRQTQIQRSSTRLKDHSSQSANVTTLL